MAVDKILQIRIQNSQQEGECLEWIDQVRIFIIPKVTAGATAYYEMSDLHLPNMHKPPVTTCMSDKALQQLATNKLELNYLCHNQAVERHIQLVTEAATAVKGFDRKGGMIGQKIQSKKLMPRYDKKKKKQFKEYILLTLNDKLLELFYVSVK